MQVVIADYGPCHTIKNRAEAEVYAAQYKPGMRLYVPYTGKTPRGMLGIYAVTIKSIEISQGKIVAECADWRDKGSGDATPTTTNR